MAKINPNALVIHNYVVYEVKDTCIFNDGSNNKFGCDLQISTIKNRSITNQDPPDSTLLNTNKNVSTIVKSLEQASLAIDTFKSETGAFFSFIHIHENQNTSFKHDKNYLIKKESYRYIVNRNGIIFASKRIEIDYTNFIKKQYTNNKGEVDQEKIDTHLKSISFLSDSEYMELISSILESKNDEDLVLKKDNFFYQDLSTHTFKPIKTKSKAESKILDDDKLKNEPVDDLLLLLHSKLLNLKRNLLDDQLKESKEKNIENMIKNEHIAKERAEKNKVDNNKDLSNWFISQLTLNQNNELQENLPKETGKLKSRKVKKNQNQTSISSTLLHKIMNIVD